MEEDYNTGIEILSVEEYSNKFKAKYKLIGADFSEVETLITPRVPSDDDVYCEITPKVIEHKDVDTEIRIVYAGNSNVETHVQPVIINSVETLIGIHPHNRMFAKYKVVQPETLYEKYTAIKDSFTRENSLYQTINYGSSSSMMVGSSSSDIWRSFVQFDVEGFNPQFKITKAYMRLYYKGTKPTGNLKLEILENDSSWGEYSITNLNKPNPINLITDNYTIREGYIDFNLSNLVAHWINGRRVNNGLIIRVANESHNEQVTFYTRETVLPPELNLEYYDTQIYSNGNSYIHTEIDVIPAGNLEEYVIISVYAKPTFHEVLTELRVKRGDDPVDNDVWSVIKVTKALVHTEVSSRLSDYREIETLISSRLPELNSIETDINISKPCTYTEIFSSIFSDVYTEISSSMVDYHELETIMAVSKDLIYTELKVTNGDHSDINAEISVFNPNIEIHLSVNTPTKLLEITPRLRSKIDYYTEIAITNVFTLTEITVSESSDLYVEIEVSQSSNIDTSISVNKDYILTIVTAKGFVYDDLISELYISHLDDKYIEIDIKSVNQIETEITSRKVSQIDTEITLSKGNIETHITIPNIAESDIYVELKPRILLVNEVYTAIRIGKSDGSYVYIL